MVEFEFPILADVSKFSDHVGSVVDGVNANLSMMGVSERLCVQAEVGTMTLAAEQEPSPEEMKRMTELIQRTWAANSPESDLTIGAPRRKSGKPSNQPTANQ